MLQIHISCWWSSPRNFKVLDLHVFIIEKAHPSEMPQLQSRRNFEKGGGSLVNTFVYPHQNSGLYAVRVFDRSGEMQAALAKAPVQEDKTERSLVLGW